MPKGTTPLLLTVDNTRPPFWWPLNSVTKENALKRPAMRLPAIFSTIALLIFTSAAGADVTSSTSPSESPPVVNVAKAEPTIQGQIQLLKDLLVLTSRVDVLEREVRDLKAKRR